MQHISTVTVGSGGAAAIEFMAVGDIPSEYTDLVVKFSARNNSGGGAAMRFNGSTTGYSERLLYGNGSGGGLSASTTTQTYFGWLLSNLPTYTSNTFSSGEVYIPNYRSSVAKSISAESAQENNATAASIYIDAGLWTGTDPITSITFLNPDGLFVENSSFSLFGITAGSSGGVVVS